jgi:putative hemolysin
MPMKFVSIVTAPFIWLLTHSTEFIKCIAKTTADGKVTEEEIKAIIKEGTGWKFRKYKIYSRTCFHIGDRK